MSPEESSKDPRDYFFGEVLRLPPGVREPDHYVLLGLQYFVSDHDEIQRAVMERMGVLDSCEADERPGYPEALAWIRRRVQSAQTTLLDEEKRKAYDARLVGATDKAEPAPTPEHKDFKLVTGRMFADRYRVLKKVRLGGLGRVYEVLDKVPVKERIPFTLRIIDGMALQDVAQACDVSLATVKRRITRARQRFSVLAKNYPLLEELMENQGSWRNE